MFRIITIGILFYWVCFVSCSSSGEEHYVDRVIDGDTFVLTSGERVQLIGVDAPETQDPDKPVEYLGPESREFLHLVLHDRQIQVEFEGERTDKYGRLLCYVWISKHLTEDERAAGASSVYVDEVLDTLPDLILINSWIIEHGYAMAYLKYPHSREAEFLEKEMRARRAGVGMWRSPRSQPTALEELLRLSAKNR